VFELTKLFLFGCSVLTPYYKEDVVYSKENLMKENEDGISVLFYLQKIYPGATYNDEVLRIACTRS
jgi:hypothetical protein